jgi:hypothetical protein
MPRRYSAQEAAQLILDSDQSDGNSIDEIEESANESVAAQSDNESVSEESDDTDVEDNPGDQVMEETVRSANGTTWKIGVAGHHMRGRLAAQNIFRQNPGPTYFSQQRVIQGSPLSAFSLFMDEPMLRAIQRNTEIEAHRVLNNNTWTLPLPELETFLGLVISRGLVGARNLPLKSLWSKTWGIQFFNKAMSRDRFIEILKYLRFDTKADRRERLTTDKFALVSQVWNAFISNCIRAFKPDVNVTVDEQLLPCKARCKYLQYMPNKPDKFGLKFWLLVDLQDKYICNGFPYLGRDDEQPRNGENLSSSVVLRLLKPYYNLGYNVTCDNYFTNLDLAKSLLSKKTTLVGTIRSNRRELPQICRNRDQLHKSHVMFEEESGALLTSYQCKKNKKVNLLSTLHNSLQVDETDNPKLKPNTVLFYNKTKCGVDVADQMARLYSVKCGSRRWPLHVFFNIIDFAIINAWIIYKKVFGISISRRKFMQLLAEELINDQPATAADPAAAAPPPIKMRRQCSGSCNKNRTTNECQNCHKPICGKCATMTKVAICPSCT